MNRRQRREAERRTKRSGNAPKAAAAPSESTWHNSRAVTDSESHARFLRLLRSNNVAPDGLGVDLLSLTAEFAKISSLFTRSTTYAGVKLQRGHLWRIPNIEADMSDFIQRMRASWKKRGAMCDYCHEVRGGEQDTAKRCQQCLQVIYCNTECQSENWARHKSFCQSVDRSKVPEDILGSLLRSISANYFMLEPIKNYVRTVLDLDNDPEAGRVHRVVLTCTLVPDPVHDKRGRPSRYYMLQFSRVERYPCPPPPPEDDEMEETLRSWGAEMMLVFRMDIPGAEVAQAMPAVADKMPLMDTVEECRADPIAHLLMLNLTIREDVDNCFRLRVPRSYFPQIERISGSPNICSCCGFRIPVDEVISDDEVDSAEVMSD